jgi:hypothetical protein
MGATTAITGSWLSRCSPAFRLLMATSWLAPEAWRRRQDEAILEAWDEGVDWDEYVRLVERHRTSALSWAALKRVAGVTIPRETAKTLKRRSDACRIKAAIHLQLLMEMLKALNTAGIWAMPLKGPLLSLELYGDAALRESKDLDVLVAQADVEAARRCLSEAGWDSKTNDARLSPRQSEFRSRHEHHVSFQHRVRRSELELHWRPRWENGDAPELRAETTLRTEWQGCRYEAMGLVDLTVDLCGHGGSHAWFRAKWLSDVARIFADGRVEAAAVLERAQSVGQERALLQCLRLLEGAYGLAVPETVEREVRSLDPFLIDRAVEKLTDPAEPRVKQSLKGVRDRFQNALYERRLWPGKSRREILEQVVFCEADFEVIRLSDRLFWLYVPLRPFLWVWRRGKNVAVSRAAT